jgi:hypothetical protein
VIPTIALAIAAALGWAFAGWALHRLWRWERQLKGARIAIAHNQRVQMQPTLLDLLRWALVLDKDKRNTGQRFYLRNKISVSILKPRDGHGKTRTRVVDDVKPAA